MANYSYLSDALQVVRFRGSQDSRVEPSLKWRLGYAPETRAAADGKTLRIVVATLHASGATGWAEVDATAYLIAIDPDAAELGPAIADSVGAENIYDFARSHLAGYLATLGVEAPLPFKSPTPEMYTIRVEEAE
ncbi:hypothetical protein [Curtobacterium flaccumfaciens]|uniref:hypothetical protein n=1 Tax=Curtobacterium flaccumfaciens TaxID=2035 RepID=UPI003D9A8B47